MSVCLGQWGRHLNLLQTGKLSLGKAGPVPGGETPKSLSTQMPKRERGNQNLRMGENFKKKKKANHKTVYKSKIRIACLLGQLDGRVSF